MPNPDVLLSPLTTQEAVLSSRIEGTQATMGTVHVFLHQGRQLYGIKDGIAFRTTFSTSKWLV
ncbi:Fic/DOC family N-terminal domain-containing protein [Desulfonatronospira sp.]|uniref:Fic/DOC family N-terminal domain-containing protein n=1 Tax=Desulfonatronospira sp. TaxID=1962951 RepID=UPI0025C53AA0|nr:Fic/DOC family N-terminal domain-containing protein [Desulfonatronospira sp.]